MSVVFKKNDGLLLKNLLNKRKAETGSKDEDDEEEEEEEDTEKSGRHDWESKRRRKAVGLQLEVRNKDARSVSLADRCKKRLKSSHFRSINEYLYTHSSKEAVNYMKPSLFNVYHQAYEEIASKWPVRPIDVIKEKIQRYYGKTLKKKNSLIMADMGCGKKPLLAEHFHQAIVHSFDFVSFDPNVVEANMARVPLENSICDCVVFCLSLMGTDIKDYLLEASRILKINGRLLIAEVVSRFEEVPLTKFCNNLRKLGFSNVTAEPLAPNQFFVLIEAVKKTESGKLVRKIPDFALKPCHYKSR